MAAEAKTKPTKEKVTDFLNRISDDTRRADCFAVVKIMEEITGSKPQMWGPAIVGFGSYTYKYASGHSGDWPVAAFSPRKSDLTIYLSVSFEQREELLEQLGKHKTGKSCLYIKRLSDVHLPTLRKLIKASTKEATKSSAKSAAN